MKNKPRVDLIILAYDNHEYLVRAVNSILQNTNYSNFNLMGVHNPCEDLQKNSDIYAFLQATKETYENFDFIINKENLYHGKGTMEGIYPLGEETKMIGVLNDDIFVPGNQQEWLNKMIEFMEEHPEVASLTPALYHLKETIYWCGRTKNSLTGGHDFLHLPKGDPRIPTKPFETSYNNMAIMLTRKVLLDEFPLGQFCPHYGSDESYCNQIKEKYPHMQHWVLPTVRLYHDNIFYLREGYGKNEVTKG